MRLDMNKELRIKPRSVVIPHTVPGTAEVNFDLHALPRPKKSEDQRAEATQDTVVAMIPVSVQIDNENQINLCMTRAKETVIELLREGISALEATTGGYDVGVR